MVQDGSDDSSRPDSADEAFLREATRAVGLDPDGDMTPDLSRVAADLTTRAAMLRAVNRYARQRAGYGPNGTRVDRRRRQGGE